jgi:SAM-dependent methyltransferase
MKTQILFSRSFLVLFIAFISSSLSAQQNKTDTGFVPEVGQQGKDVVWVPTPPELVNVMLSIAKVTPEDYVIDLGSGDGRTVIAAAKLGAHALGIEYNPDMVSLSKRNAVNDGVSDKTEFIEADLFEYDLSKATVITMFLLPEINLKLRPRLLDLKPGTRIVSNTFTMGEWGPDYEVTTEENWNSWNTALLWIVPAKVDGTWKIGEDELFIKQDFQMIFGTLSVKGKSSSITEGRLSGNEITFRVGKALFLGHISGKTMLGTVTTEDNKSDWYATKISQ